MSTPCSRRPAPTASEALDDAFSASHGINVGEGVHVYEAFHGGPREAAGYDRGNPLPLLLPAIDLLEGVGQPEAARRVAGAVARVLTERTALTPDLGGKATTTQMAEALVAALE
jgi:isocitrate dehydrogenase (NAD+)